MDSQSYETNDSPYGQLPRYSLLGGKLNPEQLEVAHSSENRLLIIAKFSKSCPRHRFTHQVNVEVQRITEQLTRHEKWRNSRLHYNPRDTIERNAEINVKARWDERGIWNHNWPDFNPGQSWGHEGKLADFNFGPNVFFKTVDREHVGDRYFTRKSFSRTVFGYARWNTITYPDQYSIEMQDDLSYVLSLSKPDAQFSDDCQEEIAWFYGEPQIPVDYETYNSFFELGTSLAITTRRYRGVSTTDPWGEELPVYEDGSRRVIDKFGYQITLKGDEFLVGNDPFGDTLHVQREIEEEYICRNVRERWQAEGIWDSNWNMFPTPWEAKWLHEALKPKELEAAMLGDAESDK